jgi:GT2 family glycosyltransferase
MQNGLPDISVILVSWNTRDLLLNCLASLPGALGLLQAEIWVVDNGSTDGSVEAIQAKHPDVRVIANDQNVGFAAANNQAIAASQGRYVLLLNSDTVALQDSIKCLVRFADTRPALGIVGPMLQNPDGSFQGSYAQQPSLRSELLSATGLGIRLYGPWYPNASPRHSQQERQVGYIQGACMLARREAIEQAGMLDEGYFMYSEEPDWCLRMQRSGWEVWYLPEAQIIHYGGQSTQQVRPEMVRTLYRSKIRFFRKHYGTLPAFLLRVMLYIILRCKWMLLRLTKMYQHSGAQVAVRWHDLHSPELR